MERVQPPAGVSIERLSLDRSTLDEVARVSVEAFADDAFFSYLMPGEQARRRALRIFFRSVVATIGDGVEAYGARDTSGRLLGTAVFVQPGYFPLPIRAQLSQLVSATRALIGRPRALLDGSRYLFAIEKVHPKEKLWYLQLLAVDPAAQRGGIGGALQQQVYPKADEAGLDSYLETQKEANLAYYRRFGYEVVHELRPVEAGPPLWSLRRAARPPEA